MPARSPGELDALDWSRFPDAYNKTDVVPYLLRQFASSDLDERAEALDGLHAAICRQELTARDLEIHCLRRRRTDQKPAERQRPYRVYAATAAAVPYLSWFAKHGPDRTATLLLLGNIAAGTATVDDELTDAEDLVRSALRANFPVLLDQPELYLESNGRLLAHYVYAATSYALHVSMDGVESQLQTMFRAAAKRDELAVVSCACALGALEDAGLGAEWTRPLLESIARRAAGAAAPIAALHLLERADSEWALDVLLVALSDAEHPVWSVELLPWPSADDFWSAALERLPNDQRAIERLLPTLADAIRQAPSLSAGSIVGPTLRLLFIEPEDGLSWTAACLSEAQRTIIRALIDSWNLWGTGVAETHRALEAVGLPLDRRALKRLVGDERTLDELGARRLLAHKLEGKAIDEVAELNLEGLAADCLLGELWRMTKLRSLDLARSEVSDHGLRVLAENGPRLRALNLSYTAISDQGLACFLGHDLERLRLRGCKIGPAGIVTLSAMPLDLLTITIDEVLDDITLASFAELKRLRHLYLWGAGVDDRMLRTIGTLPELEELYLDGVSVGEHALAELANAPLRVLRLASIATTGRIAVGCLPATLERLELADLQLADDALSALHAPMLKTLYFERLDRCPRLDFVGQLPELRRLVVRGCLFDDQLAEQALRHPTLTSIDAEMTAVSPPLRRQLHGRKRVGAAR